MQDWEPSTSIASLRARARLFQYIRTFFAEREFLEVDPPLIGRGGATDPQLQSWRAQWEDLCLYLQTSPEFFMKRLLASGSGPIYALTKAFRGGESGRYHNPEFTMLEWYLPGCDDQQLMRQVAEFIGGVLPQEQEVIYFSYRGMFLHYLHIDPHTASIAELQQCARQYFTPSWQQAERDQWLDALLSLGIQPQLPKTLVFVHDYPASQAALAKITLDHSSTPVARRFEAFVNGVELANGYWELTDAREQQQRFERDNARRTEMGLSPVEIDQQLIDALKSGLPDVAGVALGVDRLLMLSMGVESIDQVMAFPIDRV